MSEYPIPSRVTSHPITGALASLDQLLASAPPPFDQQQPDLMARGRATTRLMKDRLQDPAVSAISDAALSNGHSWLLQAANELQQAIAQQNPAVLSNGNFLGGLDALSQNLGQFPSSSLTDPVASHLDETQRRVNTIQQIQHDLEATGRGARDQIAAVLQSARDQVDAELKAIGEQRSAAAKLLGALGGDATSKGYKDTAAAEKTSADNWRKITLALGIATALAAVVLFTVFQDKTWEGAVRRAAVTVPLLILTIYAGRQAAEHRAQEREARRLQLAFGSVDAYLADLSNERRADLKNQLSAQLFGDKSDGPTAPLPAGYPSSAEIVTLLIESLRRGGAQLPLDLR